jgi:hypothetical protein
MIVKVLADYGLNSFPTYFHILFALLMYVLESLSKLIHQDMHYLRLLLPVSSILSKWEFPLFVESAFINQSFNILPF